jgi:hypothetical protein
MISQNNHYSRKSFDTSANNKNVPKIVNTSDENTTKAQFCQSETVFNA